MKLILFALLALMPLCSYAKLGLTEEQCNNAYGEPILRDFKGNSVALGYKLNEKVNIFLILLDGKVEYICYKTWDKSKLTEKQWKGWLKLNEMDGPYEKAPVQGAGTTYWSSGRMYSARVSAKDGAMVIASRKYAKWDEARQKDKGGS